MMKIYKYLFSSIVLVLMSVATLDAQRPIVFSTGGDYGTSGNHVKLYSYHPDRDTLFVEDSVPGDFSNDVLFDGEYYYLHVGRGSSHSAGGDAIYKYDEYDFSVVDSIKPISGTKEMAVKGDHLIVTRGFGAGSEYVRTYDRTNLSAGPTYADDTIGTNVKGLTVMGDSAYLGYTKNDTGHIATLDLSGGTPSFGSIHKMDTLSAGINDLTKDSDEIYALSERYNSSFVLMYAGVSTYDPATGSYNTDTNSYGSTGPVMARNDSLWFNVDTPMNVYDKASGMISELFPVDYTVGTFEPNSDRFYFQRTDFSNEGDFLITDANGTRIDSFDTDISGQAAIKFVDTTVAGVGSDKTVCADKSQVSVSGTSNTGNGTWISSGSGSFNNAGQANTSYVPSSADTSAGSVQLSYITTDTGHFIPDTASLTVNFTELPVVNAGPDIDTTVNADSIPINGSAAGGATDYYWSSYGNGGFNDSTMLSTYYHPAQGDKNAGSVNLLLTASNNGECAKDDVLNVDFTDTDIREHGKDELSMKLHPVPADEDLFVTLPRFGDGTHADYELIDLTGRIVQQGELELGTQQRLDVEDLEEGSYFLRVRTEEDRTIRKWIKR